jgi:hypothetical protein
MLNFLQFRTRFLHTPANARTADIKPAFPRSVDGAEVHSPSLPRRQERKGPHAIATTPASESIPCEICMAILFLRRRSAGRGVQIVRDVALWPIASILVCLPLRPALEAPSGRCQIHPYRSWKHAPAPTEISQNLLGALLRAPKRSIFGPPPPVGASRGMLRRCVQKLQDSLIRVWVASSTG